MPINAQISISPISNGYVVADATSGMYGDLEWRVDGSVFYPTLDALAADMGRFVSEAIKAAEARDQEQRERMAAEEAEFSGLRAQSQIHARVQRQAANRASAGIAPGQRRGL